MMRFTAVAWGWRSLVVVGKGDLKLTMVFVGAHVIESTHGTALGKAGTVEAAARNGGVDSVMSA